jgi:hypothetical protein
LSFSEFTREAVERKLGVRTQEADLFPNSPTASVPDWLPGRHRKDWLPSRRRIIMGKKRTKKDEARLRALIEEATVDCYSEDEVQVGFQVTVADNVICPFKAKVIGEEVEVVELREAEMGYGVDAVCRYKGKEYRVNIDSLEWPKQKPQGYEWVEAYRFWRGGGD